MHTHREGKRAGWWLALGTGLLATWSGCALAAASGTALIRVDPSEERQRAESTTEIKLNTVHAFVDAEEADTFHFVLTDGSFDASGLAKAADKEDYLKEQLKAKVARGEGRVAEERFRLLFSGTPCYVSMRRLVELFETWGGVFAYSDYLTFAAGGMDAGELVYDTSRPLESLAEVTALAAQRGLSNQFFAHERLAQQIRDYDVDGIVFHGIKSCRFVSSLIQKTRE